MATEPPQGFGLLPCPKCAAECRITVDLNITNDDDSLTCTDCNECFGTQDVRDFTAKWAPVLAWLDTAPPLES